MGARDKLWKLFFTLLQAKQQREAMTLLLIDGDVCIEDKDAILWEVTWFYVNLFKTTRDNTKFQQAQIDMLQHTIARVMKA